MTHIGDVVLEFPVDPNLSSPYTIGVTDGGFLRSYVADYDEIWIEHLDEKGRNVRTFRAEGTGLTDPDAGTAAWLEIKDGRRTLVLTDLVNDRELDTWPVEEESLVTVINGDRVAVTGEGGSRVFRAGEDKSSVVPIQARSGRAIVVDFDDQHLVVAKDLDTPAEVHTWDGTRVGEATGANLPVLSPDGARLAGIAHEDSEWGNENARVLVSTVDGTGEPMTLNAPQAFGVQWHDSDTLVVDSGDWSSGEGLERRVCRGPDMTCELIRHDGDERLFLYLPNDFMAVLLPHLGEGDNGE